MEKRQRSPNYPSLSLREAVDKARLLHKEVGQNPHDRETVARGMGYSSLSGASASAISALRKYGLLDGRSEEIRISDRAMAILFAHTDAERAEALRAAALEPDLFRELSQRFPGGHTNDGLIKNYLVRNGFGVQAADGVISAYKETIEFAGESGDLYDSAIQNDGADQMQAVEPVMTKPTPANPAAPRPMADGKQRLLARYDFEGGGNVEVRVTGDVDTDTALDMVETLMELKRRELERRKKATGSKLETPPEFGNEPDA